MYIEFEALDFEDRYDEWVHNEQLQLPRWDADDRHLERAGKSQSGD
jgi:hypothetical protein